MHRTSPEFWAEYRRLPESIQKIAERNFQILVDDHAHPSLHFKIVGRHYWSARIGLDYRAIALRDGSDYFWFWIGPHDKYERLINSL